MSIDKAHNLNKYYAQCSHVVNINNIYCGCCGKKIVRTWTEEELAGHNINDVVGNWEKNKKPWELKNVEFKFNLYKGAGKRENANWFETEIMNYAYIILDEWQDEHLDANEEEIDKKIKEIINNIYNDYVIPLEKINRKKLLRD